MCRSTFDRLLIGSGKMNLTVEQRKAVECETSVFLTACPGSGKTSVITAKLGRCLEALESSPRGVACITYTNAAVHEVETRVRRYLGIRDAWALDISTIHAFCLNNIFRPHSHRLEAFRDGFKVIAQDSEEFEQLVVDTRASFEIQFRSSDVDAFSQLRTTTSGAVVGPPILSEVLTEAEASEFYRLMHERRLVDFSSLLFLSLRLCQLHPEICDHLSARFAWLLVDEFQDTTDIQVAIFEEIHRRGNTKFFLVGDLNQSIFGFAGAAPVLAEQFAQHIGAERDLGLSANFRSAPAIVTDAELLFPRSPPMQPEGKNKRLMLATEVAVANSPVQAVVEIFLPRIAALGIGTGDAAVLASTWFKLIPIAKELRKQGVPVLGPGARPYRRQRQFAALAERICGYLCEPDFEAFVGVERALYDTIFEVSNRPPQGLFSYEGRRLVYEILADAGSARDHAAGGMEFLYSLVARVSERLLKSEHIRSEDAALLRESVAEMERDIVKNGSTPDELTIEDLGLFARPKRAIKLLTFHAAKGREFEAVVMVDLNEGSIPFYRATTADEFAEAQRLFYVGLTRAEKYLLYAPDRSHHRNRPSRYLGEEYMGKCG